MSAVEVPAPEPGQIHEWPNEVRLRGRLAADPAIRDLPSGDELVQLRLVVPRPPDPQARDEGRRPPTVDTFDVACWPGAADDLARLLRAGDVVEVLGPLRRRFYRTQAGVASRHEVHATTLDIVRAPAGVGAGRESDVAEPGGSP